MDSYQLSEAARDDLDALYLYGILNHGLRQVDKYFDDLVERFVTLSKHPDFGNDYQNIAPSLHRYEYQSHAIYYQALEQGILIVRVLGGRQDPARHF